MRSSSAEPLHVGRLAPGLAWTAVLATGSTLTTFLVPSLPTLALCVFVGALWTNLGGVADSQRPGLQFASRTLLRLGVVLLGLQFAVDRIVDLSWAHLLIVLVVVVITFVGTFWIGRRLGLSRSFSLLTATGFSICGASAIAAAKDTVGADDDETAYAIGLVAVCGALAIVLLPLLRAPLGLSEEAFGSWVGASVHDVAQVVATSSVAGVVALQVAVLIKLTRVVLLAPLLLILGVDARRRESGRPTQRSAPLVPLFVLGFLAAMALRSTGILRAEVLDVAGRIQDVFFALALVALGAGVDVRSLRRVGLRPLVLALLSWLLVAGVSLVGVSAIA